MFKRNVIGYTNSSDASVGVSKINLRSVCNEFGAK